MANRRTPADVPQLHIVLLGGFRIQRTSHGAQEQIQDTAWTRKRAKVLVQILAVEPSHRLHREQILDYLWPDVDPPAAENSLRQTLYIARRVLEPDLTSRTPSSYIRFIDESICLEEAHVEIDADRYEQTARRALARAHRIGSAGAPAPIPVLGRSPEADITVLVAELESAFQLYSGSLLPDEIYESWTESRRQTLADLHVEVLLTLAHVLERDYHVAGVGAGSRLIAALQQIVASDPTREDVHRHLMRLYVLAGSRHAALRQYAACEAALRELGVTPEAETAALHRDVLARSTGAQQQASANDTATWNPPLPPPLERMPQTPLFGRQHALVALREDIRGAREGQGQFVLIGGEAGVGKTRLAGEVARAAWQDGMTVLWGTAYAREGLVPYGPLITALEGYATRLPVGDREALMRDHPESAALIPALAVHPPSGERLALSRAAAGGAASRLFAALVRLVKRLAAERPLLLVIDDLHAADVETLQVIHHLAYQNATTSTENRWAVLATYREEEVAAGSELNRLMRTLTADGVCRLIDLLRLDRRHGDQLVRSLLSPVAAVDEGLLAQLHALSLGNPLFLTELIRAMQEQGELAVHDGAWQLHARLFDERAAAAALGLKARVTVPERVRQLIEMRVQQLDPSLQRTLDLAAVAGMTFTFELLRRTAHGPATGIGNEAQILDGLDWALNTHLVEESEDGYMFRHPLLRAALYERLSRARRAALHRALASTIEEHGPGDGAIASVEALAHHYARADDRDKAAVYLERAGDRARAVYANEAASEYYREALARLDTVGQAVAVARVCEKLGATLTLLGRYDEALGVLDRAARTYDEMEDLDSLGRTIAQVGRVHFPRGTAGEGIARILPLVDCIAAVGSSSGLAPLYAALAHLYHAAGAYRDSVTAGLRAAELSRACGDDATQAEAEIRAGVSLYLLGRTREARETLTHAIPLAGAVGDLLSLSRACTCMGTMYSREGDLEAARPYDEQALAAAERLGEPGQIVLLLSNSAGDAYVRGAWDEAQGYVDRAMAVARSARTPGYVTYPLSQQAGIFMATGRWEAATRVLNETMAIAQRSGDAQIIRDIQHMLAHQEVFNGNPQAAVARLEPLYAEAGGYTPGSEERDIIVLLPTLAWAHLELGDVERADQLAQQAVQLAVSLRDRFNLPDAFRVRGMVRTRQQRWDEAERDLAEAMTAAEALQYPYGQGQILHAMGQLNLQRGDHEQGRWQLSEALAIFQRLGAAKDVERVDAELCCER